MYNVTYYLRNLLFIYYYLLLFIYFKRNLLFTLYVNKLMMKTCV